MSDLSSKIFVFIAGVEGSGTLMLLKLLESLDYSIAIGGRHFSPKVREIATSLNQLTQTLWAYPRTKKPKEREVIIQKIRKLQVPANVSHVIHKRSYPFFTRHFYPELGDLCSFASNIKIIIMRRQFKECVISILRRKFEFDINKAIERIGEAFQIITSQILRYDSQNIVEINYDDILEKNKKEKILDSLETFLEVRKGDLINQKGMITRPTTKNIYLIESKL